MDATINEGNVGRNFSPVDKLKINLQNDGGESLWVPEDSVQLDELYTSTNGTYYAAPRDIYGWGVVTVDVDNSIDEPDDLYDDDDYPDDDEPDEEWDEDDDDWEDDDWDEDDEWGDDGITDGDDYDYIDDDGNLVEEECPAYIEIVNQPFKIEYTEGDSINLTGLAVLAYKADGTLWTKGNNGEVGHYAHGRIPNSELIINPTNAPYNGRRASDLIPGGLAIAGGRLDAYNIRDGNPINYFVFEGDVIVAVLPSDGSLNAPGIIYCSENPSSTGRVGFDQRKRPEEEELATVYLNSSYTYQNKTVYFSQTIAGYKPDFFTAPVNTGVFPYSPNAIAWTAIFGGETGETGETENQSIEVNWQSPCGLEHLTDFFNISVKAKDPFGGHWGGSHYSGKF